MKKIVDAVSTYFKADGHTTLVMLTLFFVKLGALGGIAYEFEWFGVAWGVWTGAALGGVFSAVWVTNYQKDSEDLRNTRFIAEEREKTRRLEMASRGIIDKDLLK